MYSLLITDLTGGIIAINMNYGICNLKLDSDLYLCTLNKISFYLFVFLIFDEDM